MAVSRRSNDLKLHKMQIRRCCRQMRVNIMNTQELLVISTLVFGIHSIPFYIVFQVQKWVSKPQSLHIRHNIYISYGRTISYGVNSNH